MHLKKSEGNIASFAYFESLISRSWKFFPAPFRFILLCLLILVLWGIFFFFPATDYAPGSMYPECPFHALTGLHCAGCGSLRTMSCLAKGDFGAAWGKNKLALLLMPFVLWSFFAYGAKCFKISFPQIFIKPIFIWLLLALIIIYTIIRNIPIHPMTLLAPH
jgi:uncharacterized protein DUF2752